MISQTTLFWQQQKIDLTAIDLTKDTTYLALTGELWGVFCKDFGENCPRYNGIALYNGTAIFDLHLCVQCPLLMMTTCLIL